MTGSEKKQQAIEGFRIVPADPDGVPVARQPWRRLGIFRSPVCIAVHLQPMTEQWGGPSSEIEKNALFRYLRRIYQTTLEYDMQYPVAAVVAVKSKKSEVAKEVDKWTSDQSWHRGGFTLYVEERENRDFHDVDRLSDLLQPTPQQIMVQLEEKPRDLAAFSKDLRDAAAKLEGSKEESDRIARQILDMSASRIMDKTTYSDDEQFPQINYWWERYRDETRNLVEGSGS